MINSIQPLDIESVQYKKETYKNKSAAVSNTSTNNSNTLDKSLLALAIIGAATLLSSCAKVVPDKLEEEVINEVIDTTASKPVSNYAFKRCEDILSSLGALVDEDATLSTIKTVYCEDEAGIEHFMKPVYVGAKEVRFKGMELYTDSTGGGQYKAIARNADNGGIDISKLYEDGVKEKTNLLLNKDGSVTEFEYINDNYMLEKSIYKKNEDGSVERSFADGSKKIYKAFTNDYSYPVPITFNPSVEDWSDVDSGTNI